MIPRFKQITLANADQSSSNVWTLTSTNLGYDPSGIFYKHQLQVSGINGDDAGENGTWKVEFKPDTGASGVITEQATNMGQEDTVLFDAAFCKTLVVTVVPHGDAGGTQKLVVTSRRSE